MGAIASLILLVCAVPCRGDEPCPVLAYDFSKTENGSVHDDGSAKLDILAPSIKEDALTGSQPALPVDTEKASAWLAANTPDEFSAAFWIRFDCLPSAGNPFSLFGVQTDKEGHLTIRLYAQTDDFLGDFVMTSTETIAKGEWHHIEFTYSKIQSRASLYLDGRFQWENDCLHLPRLRYGPLAFADHFRGAIRDIRLYDIALPSERLIPAANVPAQCAELKSRATKAAANSQNPHLRKWLDGLATQTAGLAPSPGKATIAELSDLRRDIENAEKILKDLERNSASSRSTAPAVVYSVKPLSQEIFLPHTIPERGEIGGPVRIAATRGEYENGSALLFAFRPTVIRNVEITPLKGPNGKTLSPDNVDVKLVKRWIRAGGAWLCYKGDRRQRNLTPDLLIYDDNLVKVDEWRRRNYLRFDLPGGERYLDISDTGKAHSSWDANIPIHDAKTLQPVKIPEAGRNQQFLLTAHIPDDTPDGLYRGQIRFIGADVTMDLVVRVLPFDLPEEPSTYYDIDKTYISMISSFPGLTESTLAERKDYMRTMLRMARSHNLFHLPGIWDSEEMIGLSLATGMIPDKIFGRAGGTSFPGVHYNWQDYFPDLPADELTLADKEKALPLAIRSGRPWRKYFQKNFPTNAEPYVSFFTETRDFERQNTQQAELGIVASALGQKVFSRGYPQNIHYAGDLQDMHIATGVFPDEAKAWHATGGERLNVSSPYPSSENPETFRRRVGLQMYKSNYDGYQIRDFFGIRDQWNEFADTAGDDGSYRNFCMVYPQRDGYIGKLALEGLREAYDDLRYATRLRQLALANRDSKDNDLRRESRRQLLWLENLDADTADLDMVRFGIIRRICLLQGMIQSRKGVLPQPDGPRL